MCSARVTTPRPGDADSRVEPRDPVLPAARRECGERIVQRADPVGVDRQHRARVRPSLTRASIDDAGQAHPPERRLELPVAHPGLKLDELAIGAEQRDRLDVRPERPRGAVILAVDVARDRPADGDVLCTGHHRDHPAGGHNLAQKLADRDAGLRGDDPTLARRARSASAGCVSITRPPEICAASP